MEYKRGTWAAQCAWCGVRYHATELRKQWDGLWACPEHFELRQSQDLAGPVLMDPPIPWVSISAPAPPLFAPVGIVGYVILSMRQDEKIPRINLSMPIAGVYWNRDSVAGVTADDQFILWSTNAKGSLGIASINAVEGNDIGVLVTPAGAATELVITGVQSRIPVGGPYFTGIGTTLGPAYEYDLTMSGDLVASSSFAAATDPVVQEWINNKYELLARGIYWEGDTPWTILQARAQDGSPKEVYRVGLSTPLERLNMPTPNINWDFGPDTKLLSYYTVNMSGVGTLRYTHLNSRASVTTVTLTPPVGWAILAGRANVSRNGTKLKIIVPAYRTADDSIGLITFDLTSEAVDFIAVVTTGVPEPLRCLCLSFNYGPYLTTTAIFELEDVSLECVYIATTELYTRSTPATFIGSADEVEFSYFGIWSEQVAFDDALARIQDTSGDDIEDTNGDPITHILE